MAHAVPDILARIIQHKAEELNQVSVPRAELERRAEVSLAGRRDFRAALLARKTAIIAEIKKASPSRGALATSFEPAEIAREYESGGAAALSVLTDERFFQGALADLEAARAAVQIPALRKDFTIDDYHVVQAAAHGADAILLIAAVLTCSRLRSLRELATQYAMASLVEVHTSDELDLALDSGAEIIGVNNRDLHTFEVSLDTSLRLADRIPSSLLRISESGIQNRRHIEELQRAGYNAFLVGEHLMKAESASTALRDLGACE